MRLHFNDYCQLILLLPGNYKECNFALERQWIIPHYSIARKSCDESLPISSIASSQFETAQFFSEMALKNCYHMHCWIELRWIIANTIYCSFPIWNDAIYSNRQWIIATTALLEGAAMNHCQSVLLFPVNYKEAEFSAERQWRIATTILLDAIAINNC